MDTTITILITGTVFFLLSCIAILDAARKDFGGIEKKAAWMLFVGLVPFIGCIIYFIFGARRGKLPERIIEKSKK